MRKLTAALCLTLTVLFGSVEMSLSSDFQKNAITLTYIQLRSLFYKLLSPTSYTGNVWGHKTGYLKKGRWDADYLEVSPTKGFVFHCSY